MGDVLAQFGLGIFSAGVQGNINRDNIRFQQETNAHNEELMRESWEREDNAVQRRADDLESAGMNRLYAAGTAAQSGGSIQLQAPKISASPADAAIRAASSAANIAQTQASADKTRADARKANVDADLAEMLKDQNYYKGVAERYGAAWKAADEKNKSIISANLAAESDFQNKHRQELEQMRYEMEQSKLSEQKIKERLAEVTRLMAEKDLNWYTTEKWLNAVGRFTGTAAQGMRTFYPGLPK